MTRMGITSSFRTWNWQANVSHVASPRGSPNTDQVADRITNLLGQGTFGKVVKAFDRRAGQYVAVKVIRAVQKYRDAAKIELRALQTLRDHDADNRYRCIHLRDCFDFRGHICIVTDLLDLSLFDFLKGNSFVPFPNSHIQSFARQLLTSVACKRCTAPQPFYDFLTALQSSTTSISSIQT